MGGERSGRRCDGGCLVAEGRGGGGGGAWRLKSEAGEGGVSGGVHVSQRDTNTTCMQYPQLFSQSGLGFYKSRLNWGLNIKVQHRCSTVLYVTSTTPTDVTVQYLGPRHLT